MKEIRAYIESHRLNDVVNALRELGISGITAINAVGLGQKAATDNSRRVKIGSSEFLSCMKLEIICEEPMVDQVVDAISKAAWAGKKSHGVICVGHIEKFHRINPLRHGFNPDV